MGHGHARSIRLAIAAHLLAALLLFGCHLCVWNDARHDRPPQDEDNGQQPKIEEKPHRLNLAQSYRRRYTMSTYIRYHQPTKVSYGSWISEKSSRYGQTPSRTP